MKQRQWQVSLLSEFFPRDARLLGLNINRGQEIKIRLRYSYDENSFLPYAELLGTMLHELTHIIHGPHNSTFYKLLDQLKEECEDLMIRGTFSFQGEGHRLGRNPNSYHNQFLEAAARRNSLVGSFNKLGGDSLMQTLYTPREMAALASERRFEDSLWCATDQQFQEVLQQSKLEYEASKRTLETFKRQTSNCNSTLIVDEEEPKIKRFKTEISINKNKDEITQSLEWICSSCTFLNSPSTLKCIICETKK